MITLDQYIPLSQRTHAPHNTRDCHLLGLYGESGEVIDLVKKIVFHGVPLTATLIDKMRFEIGDVLWYVAAEYDRKKSPCGHWPRSHRTIRVEIVAIDLARAVNEYDRSVGGLWQVVDTLADVCASFSEYVRLNADDPAFREFELTLPECAQANVDKLAKRYPDKFNTADSLAKRDEA